MDAVLAWITQPVPLALLIVAVLALRVVMIARRLKSASRGPTLRDLRALAEARRCVELPRKALDEAKGIGLTALAQARAAADPPAVPESGMAKRYR